MHFAKRIEIADTAKHLLGVCAASVLQTVDHTQLNGIDTESFREHVHGGFNSKGWLQNAKGPHRAGGGVVGIVAIGKDADVFDFIRARAQNCGLADSSLCRKAVRTAIGLEVNLNGLYPSVFIHTDFVMNPHRMALCAADQRISPGEDQPHRLLRLERRNGQNCLIDHVLFAAETTSGWGHNHADFVKRHIENLCQQHSVMRNVLITGFDNQYTVRVAVRNARLCFQIRVFNRLRGIVVFKNNITFGEACLYVALFDTRGAHDIVRMIVMKNRFAGYGLIDTGYNRKLSVDDLYALFCRFSLFERRSHNGDDRLTVEANLALCQHWLVMERNAKAVNARNVFTCYHTFNARHFERFFIVDADNLRMRFRAADQMHMQHSGHFHIPMRPLPFQAHRHVWRMRRSSGSYPGARLQDSHRFYRH